MTQNNDQAAVSIFITAYNIEKYIGAAIESVLAQSFQDFQIIIAEDCSTDATRGIVIDYSKRYPEKITAILGEKNVGIAANTNRALALCNGKYIAKLDGDDLWYPDKLEKQFAYMEAHAEVVLSYHDAEIFDSETGNIISLVSQVGQSKAQRVLPHGGVEALFQRFPGISASSLMFRASAVGKTRYEERVRYINDWLFDVEVLANGGKIGAVQGVLGRYRRHTRNITLSLDHNSTVAEETLIASAILSSRYPQLARLCRRKNRYALTAEMIVTIQSANYVRSWYLLNVIWLNGGYLKGSAIWITYILGRGLIAYIRQRHPSLAQRLVKYVYS